MHHYNFPPYLGRRDRPHARSGRREIGHGRSRAGAAPVLPEGPWPYTMRLVSEILSSNGSTSMASVCGSTLALMDAGVPIKRRWPASRWGSSRAKARSRCSQTSRESRTTWATWTSRSPAPRRHHRAADGHQDHLTHEILRRRWSRLVMAGLFVLDKMLGCCRGLARDERYAPRITTIMINPDKIRDVIGPGGKNDPQDHRGDRPQIDVEDDGRVFIAAVDQACAARDRLDRDGLGRGREDLQRQGGQHEGLRRLHRAGAGPRGAPATSASCSRDGSARPATW